MKLLFKFLLQIPLLFFFITGVEAFTGKNWTAILVGISCLFLYTTADYLEDT